MSTMEHLLRTQRWFILIVFVITGVLLFLLGPILSPFLAGALLAYLFDPLADRLEESGLTRTSSVIVVFVLLTLILTLLLLFLIPSLSQQFQSLVRQVPQVVGLFETKIFPVIEDYLGTSISFGEGESIKKLIAAHWEQTGSVMAQVVTGVTKSGMAVLGWLANALLIPVVMFYLLRDWDVMMAKIARLLPRNLEPKVTAWAKECDEVLGAFIKGQLMVMVMLGVIYAFGLWVIGVDLALIIGLIAGVASIVPYLGTIVGIASAAIAAYVQFNDPMILVYVGIVFGIGQMLEGMVLTPLLVGDKIGLHPVAVIFAIMAGGQLFGFVGVLIALPVAAVIMVFLRHLHDGYKNSSLYGSDLQPEKVQSEQPVNQEKQIDEQR
jgi:predicted PurR-regulated permease PerM